MFRFNRDKATEVSRRQRSQHLLMTAQIDANLPVRPSLDGYKVEVLSLDSVADLFRTQGTYRDRIVQSHRAGLKASESEPGKVWAR
jgi:hypothetical protein